MPLPAVSSDPLFAETIKNSEGNSRIICRNWGDINDMKPAARQTHVKQWVFLMWKTQSKGFIAAFNNLKVDPGWKSALSVQLGAWNMLPMPVRSSPILLAARGAPTRADADFYPVAPEATTAYDSMRDLLTLMRVVSRCMYAGQDDSPHRAVVSQLDLMCDQDISQASATLDMTLRHHVYEPEYNGEITPTEATLRFARVVEMYTLWLINRIEVTIYDMLVVGVRTQHKNNIPPEEYALTPHCAPSGLMWVRTGVERTYWARCSDVAHYSFNMRTHLYNERMAQILTERGKGEKHVPQDPFCVDSYRENTWNAFNTMGKMRLAGCYDPFPALYNEWILFTVLQGYKDFVNYTYRDLDDVVAQ